MLPQTHGKCFLSFWAGYLFRSQCTSKVNQELGNLENYMLFKTAGYLFRSKGTAKVKREFEKNLYCQCQFYRNFFQSTILVPLFILYVGLQAEANGTWLRLDNYRLVQDKMVARRRPQSQLHIGWNATCRSGRSVLRNRESAAEYVTGTYHCRHSENLLHWNQLLKGALMSWSKQAFVCTCNYDIAPGYCKCTW